MDICAGMRVFITQFPLICYFISVEKITRVVFQKPLYSSISFYFLTVFFLMFCLKLHTFFHVCNLRQNIKTNTFQELMVSENSQQCLWGGCRLRIVFPTRRNNWYLYNNNKSIQGHVTIIFGPSGLRVSTINGVFLSLSFFLSAWVTFLP